MAVLTAKQITDLYLYNRTITPQNKVDGALIRFGNPRDDVARSLIRTDTRDFMASAGRFAVGSQFDLINKFFDPSFLPSGSITVTTGFSKRQLAARFGLSSFGWAMKQQDWRDGNDDYAERSYIWNTQEYQISNEAIFIIEPNGNKRIENYAVEPRRGDDGVARDNFDFKGANDNFINDRAGEYLEKLIDPSGIGRRVNIIFEGADVTRRTYDQQSYSNDVQLKSTFQGGDLFKLSRDIETLTFNLFNDGTTKFLDDNNKPIIYGTRGNDRLFTSNGLTSIVSNYPYLKEYARNGIVLVGGAGNDTLISQRSGNNILIGGTDNDIYIPFDTTDKVVEKSNEGIDIINTTNKGTFDFFSKRENYENVELIQLIGTDGKVTANCEQTRHSKSYLIGSKNNPQ